MPKIKKRKEEDDVSIYLFDEQPIIANKIRERDEDWIHLTEDDKGFIYDKYFVDHPEQVLGTMREVSGRFGKRFTFCLCKRQ